MENFQEENPTDLQGKTQRIEIDAEHDFSALELIGYRIDDEGFILIDYLRENNCDLNLFREYFFGTWKSDKDEDLIIDDSEKSSISINPSRSWLFYTLNLNNDTLSISVVDSVEICIYWLDIKSSDILYMEGGYSFPNENEIKSFNTNNDEGKTYSTRTFTKTDAPINEPENNFLSDLMLIELREEYNIEQLFNEVDYTLDNIYYFNLFYQPVYLISKSPDKFVLKTRLVFGYGNAFIDVTYTTEKINGDWVQTREITPEALERAREEIKNDGYVISIY